MILFQKIHLEGDRVSRPPKIALDLINCKQPHPLFPLRITRGDFRIEFFRDAVEGDDVVAGSDELLLEPEFLLEVFDLGKEADDFCGDGAEGFDLGAGFLPVGFRRVIEVVEMDDFVLDEKIQFAAEEAAEVLVDEVVEGVLAGVFTEVLGEDAAAALLLAGVGGIVGGQAGERAFCMFR